MSSTTILGGPRWCPLSTHRPGRSARAARFSGRLSHFVSKRPIWLAEAAHPGIARSPTIQRIGPLLAPPLPHRDETYRKTQRCERYNRGILSSGDRSVVDGGLTINYHSKKVNN